MNGTWMEAAREPSTTASVVEKSSEKMVSSWKKSQQNRYSAVAVSISSLFTLRNSTYKNALVAKATTPAEGAHHF